MEGASDRTLAISSLPLVHALCSPRMRHQPAPLQPCVQQAGQYQYRQRLRVDRTQLMGDRPCHGGQASQARAWQQIPSIC